MSDSQKGAQNTIDLLDPDVFRSEAASVLAGILGVLDDRAIIVLDPRGQVVRWWDGARRLHGYEPSEIVGRSFSFLHTDEDVARGEHERKLEAALEEGQFEGECWQTRRDGSRFWAHLAIVPVRDDDGGLLGFAQATHQTAVPRPGQGPGAWRPAVREGRQPASLASSLNDGIVFPLFQLGLHLQKVAAATADAETARQLDMAADELDAPLRELRSLVFNMGADPAGHGDSERPDEPRPQDI